MTTPVEKLINSLKNVTGVVGIAVMSRDGTPVSMHGVSEADSARTAFASTTLGEIAAAFKMGKARHMLVMGSNYKILTFEHDEHIVSVFMSPGASIQAVKSKIPSQ